MFITYGVKRIRHKLIWFLADIEEFTDRKLFLFYLPNDKISTVLVEKHKLSGEVFSQKNSVYTSKSILDREKNRLLYTSNDIKIKKGKPYGWIYGENKEIKTKDGIVIKQYACDYYGQKELI